MSGTEGGARPLVLFVCRHGAAKSVLAAAGLERLASAAGVAVDAVAAGIEPDAEVAPAVIDVIGEGTRRSMTRPHPVSPDESARAWRTITFDLDPVELPVVPRNLVRWDGLPPASKDPGRTLEALEPRIRGLLDELIAGMGDGSTTI
jgi:arsenate reductase (thioredoxin)